MHRLHPVGPGRRERAKAERRERLKAAALEVFAEKGYQAATTREIALRAGIGAGTLFRYAEQKRDLLLMIVNDDLDAIDKRCLARIDREAPLVEQLLELFAPRFRYWSAHLDLAREALHETVLARAGGAASKEARRYLERRNGLLAIITDIVRRQQAAGTIDPHLDANLAATLFLAIYLAQIRLWVAQTRPVCKKGIETLRHLLSLAIDGVRSRP
jgi:AcrR family transcriptional regulator